MSKPVSGKNSVREIEHLWIEMPDGVRLAARIWMPVFPDDRTVPAILEYIPYRKRDMVRVRDERNHWYFASQGYVSIRVDMRGSGDSEGIKPDMYDPPELDDAVSVINWISCQPWCDGNVGMMGTSWGGTASLQAAARRPEALKAIIAVCATNNRFDDDIHHMGGCLLTDTVEWGATLPAILASPPDPVTVGESWRALWMQRLEALTFPLENWVRHETRDDYWRWGAVNESPADIQCPVLAIGGWVDRYSNTVMNVLSQGHDKIWGIVGPWGHHYPDLGSPGPGIGFQQEAVRWWDRWLKGWDNGVDRDPKLRVWMQSFSVPGDQIEKRAGQWVSEGFWPSDNTKTFVTKLSDLTPGRPELVKGDVAEVPWNLNVGSNAGDTGYFGRTGGLPTNQSVDDSHSLTFETEPLEEPLEILGSASFSVCFSADREDATIVARLNDVSPDDQVARVAYGIKNLKLDENGAISATASCQETGKANIELHNTAYRFEKGHRIRLSVSSSYWPVIWPSPKRTEISVSTIDSTLALPIRLPKEDAEEPLMLEPTVPPGSPTSTVKSSKPVKRSKAFNEETGEKSIGWCQDFLCVHHELIDLDFGYETRALHTANDDDPNSACSRFDHRMHFCRGDWKVDVYSMAQLTSDESEFRLEGEVRVVENGVAIFERQWSPRITRRWS